MVSINNLINPIKHIAADFHEARTHEPTYSMASPTPSGYSGRGPNSLRVGGRIKRPARQTTRRWQQIARRRASQRWAALLQRVGGKCHGMVKHLGQVAWTAFKRHSKQRYRPRFVSRFVPAGPDPALECVGLIDTAGGCPHQHVVALPKLASLSSVEAAQASESLKCLHLDHEIEVQQICDLWKQLTPPRPAAWDENVKPSRLCELIFGVEGGYSAETEGRSIVQFRCACWGSSFGMCHGTSTRHYGHVLRLDDLRK